MNVKSSTAVLLWAICVATRANAGPFEDGLAADIRGDNATAVQLWRPLAERGDARAQLSLAMMYHYAHQGVPLDHAEAAKWYRKAADQGNAPAQARLGLMYFRGQGVPRDYVQAYKWNTLAAASLPEGDPLRQTASLARDMAAQQLMPGQIAEAQKLAREWRSTIQKGKLPPAR
ncbi:MAG: sel1 repeat family protein [Nevskia sp.]|nr:sel1 repeat family protein [Nevskia sp.]